MYQSLSGKGSLLASGEKAEFKWFRDGQEFDPLERFNVMFKVRGRRGVNRLVKERLKKEDKD